MSHWNPLERQLRCRTPPGPSPSLKARLFGEPQSGDASGSLADASRRRGGPGAWHWLAPTMAVFALGLFVFGNHLDALHQFDAAPSAGLLATSALVRPELSS